MDIRLRWCAGVIASAFLVAGCGGTDEAKRGVAEFRSLVAQRAYAEIYYAAGAELRQTATQEQFERLMTTLDTRLGAWQSAEEPAWNVTRGTGVLWRIQRGGAVLLGYHVNSPLLAAQ